MKLIQIAGPCCRGIRCHAIYEDQETGAFVIQGRRLSPPDRSVLTLSDDEEVVAIPADLVAEWLSRRQP